MPRRKKTSPSELIAEMVQEKPMEVDVASLPLETLADYIRYNAEARKANKRLKICRYPIKPCPIDLHPKEKVVFRRNDQPSNPLNVHKSDDMIDFHMTLTPGRTYSLPRYIIDYLSRKGTPVWKWFEKADGSKETHVDHHQPRFSLTPVYD